MIKDINLFNRSDFYNLKLLTDFEVRVQSIVLLPINRLHDSGYRFFSVVAINELGELLGRTEPYDIFDFFDIDCYFAKVDLLKCNLFRIQFSRSCRLNTFIKAVGKVVYDENK